VYPVLLRIGTFEITSFGVLVACGALVGLWVFTREAQRAPWGERAVNAAIAGVFGGLIGAKLLWTFEHRGEEPFVDLIFSRGGLSWFGGFAGGVATGLAVIAKNRLPALAVVSAATPRLAVGHAIGRLGGFLVGDDYGKPTSLPWGVAFPQGLPPTDVRVHPTQLYEAFALVPVALLLLRWRHAGKSDRFVVGAYLVLMGSIRFLIEFLRVDRQVLGPLTVAHIASLGAVLVGVVMLARRGS